MTESGAGVVRPMRPDDRERIVDILSVSDPWVRLGFSRADWLASFAPAPEGCETYAVEVEGSAEGVAVVRRNFLIGDYLVILAVAPERRGEGLGRVLLGAVEAIVLARARNFFLCVSDFNVNARRFYARMGYVEVGPLPDLMVAGAAEILMRKTTGPARP